MCAQLPQALTCLKAVRKRFRCTDPWELQITLFGSTRQYTVEAVVNEAGAGSRINLVKQAGGTASMPQAGT